MITMISSGAKLADGFRHIVSALAGCATAAADIRRRRHTYRSLSALDDRTLRDIGLNRTMLASVAATGVSSARDAAPR
jgi:uncharacterized protein YjiS (DUF1127 family)